MAEGKRGKKRQRARLSEWMNGRKGKEGMGGRMEGWKSLIPHSAFPKGGKRK